MASDCERQRLDESDDESDEISSISDPLPLFTPPDVTLEVEGKKLHVHRQVLVEKSPVFRRMLESDFKEKHVTEIPLPEKNYKDVELFLRTLYYPDITCPIARKTVLSILPIAEEYQVWDVKDRCQNWILLELLAESKKGISSIEIKTLLQYVNYGDLFNLPFLHLAIKMCAKYDSQVLIKAGIDSVVTEKMFLKITMERNKMLEAFTLERFEKGKFASISEIFGLLGGMPESKREAMMTKYENSLINTCESSNVSIRNIVKLILATEQFKLQKLQEVSIKLASKCSFDTLRETKGYLEISCCLRRKISASRIVHLERYGTSKDVL